MILHPMFTFGVRVYKNNFVNPHGAVPISTNQRLRGLRIPATSSTCVNTVVVVGSSFNQTVPSSYLACETWNGKQYRVTGIPDHVIDDNEKSIADGIIELDLPAGAYLDETTATLKLPTSQLGLKFKATSGKSRAARLFDRSRRSLAVTGTRSALVVRIIASNIAPGKSEATLSNNLFGNGADGTVDPMTLKSVYTTCSHGQLTIVPASDRNGRSINIRKGEHDQLICSYPFSFLSVFLPIRRLISLKNHTTIQEPRL